MLETLRAYGLDRLVAAGEEEEARSRHSAHYAAMVEGGGTLADPETLAFLLPEEGNLRQALDWTVAAGDGREAALRLAVGLGRMYMDSLRASLALAALDGALSLPGPSIRDVWWATALAMRAGCDFLVHHGAGGTDQAERDLTEALRVARELGERGLESACLNALGGLASARGDVEGLRRRLQEAMPVALAIGDPIPATNLVALLVAEERLQDARAQIERAALAMARASRSPWLETSLALVELSEGRLDAAAAALNRARTSSDPSELLRLSIVSLEACLATLSEDEATALERTAELFAAMARDGTLQGGIGLGAELGILLLARHGQPTLAAELVGRLGNADETPFVAAWRREAEALVVEALGHAGFEAARAAGSVRPHRRIGQDVLSALRAVGDPGEGGHERDARPGDGGSAGDNGTLQTVADRPAARPRPPEAVAAETDGARREEDAALLALTTLSRLSLEECTVVGAYRRYDERVRSELADWRRRMSRPLLEPTLTRENFLVWAAPGSGKSFLVQETARALAGQARYFELNLAREDRDAFVAALARVRGEPSAFLCLLDEIDARADEAWPYEESFSLLDLNLSEERRAVFVLVGSAPGGLAAMVEAMAARPKGRDLLDRVPAGHRFTLPALSLEDRAVIVASQMLDAAAALGRRVREVERFALYYALVETSLASPRQLRDLAVAAVQNLPPDEVRLRYDDLFYRGDSRNQAFWAAHRAAAEALGGRCVRIEA
jgi:Flp pilus assembly protein TadD